MRIRQELLQKYSRANLDRVVSMVVDDEELAVELMVCMFGEELKLAQRAAHAVGLLGREEPEKLIPWFEELVDAIENPIHQSLRRCGVRYFSELKTEIPLALETRLIGLCMKFLADPKTEVAIAVFAMQFVADRVDAYPASRGKLIKCLKSGIPSGTAGYCNRAQKVLKQLEADD